MDTMRMDSNVKNVAKTVKLVKIPEIIVLNVPKEDN